MHTRNEVTMRMFFTPKASFLAVVLVLGILVVPKFSMAANHYVRAGATGNGSGSDWTNAYTDVPAKLVRGDTYYLAVGTYAPNGHIFNDPGTAIITLQTATVAHHGTSTGWSNSYAGQVQLYPLIFEASDYIISGAYRSSMDSGYGMVLKTFATCSSGGYGRCPAIWLWGGHGVSNITIEYVDMPGYGQNNPTVQKQYGFFAVSGIPAVGGFSNVKLSYDYIHDLGTGGAPILTGGVNGMKVQYSELARNTSVASYHSEAWSDRGSYNITFAYNLLEDINGSGDIVILNAGSPATVTNWSIYGNLFWQKDAGNYIGDGVISCINGNICSDFYIYNNTFADFGGGTSHNGISWSRSDPSSTNIQAKNNLWYDSVQVSPDGQVTSDYNYYARCSNVPSETHIQTGSSDPFTDSSSGDFHLNVETDDGLHFSSPYDIDPDGTKRGSDNSIWSRGAYQFVSGSSSSPEPPSSLVIVAVH